MYSAPSCGGESRQQVPYDVSQVTQSIKDGYIRQLRQWDIDFANTDAVFIQRVLSAVDDATSLVERAYLLAFEKNIMPEVRMLKLGGQSGEDFMAELQKDPSLMGSEPEPQQLLYHVRQPQVQAQGSQQVKSQGSFSGQIQMPVMPQPAQYGPYMLDFSSLQPQESNKFNSTFWPENQDPQAVPGLLYMSNNGSGMMLNGDASDMMFQDRSSGTVSLSDMLRSNCAIIGSSTPSMKSSGLAGQQIHQQLVHQQVVPIPANNLQFYSGPVTSAGYNCSYHSGDFCEGMKNGPQRFASFKADARGQSESDGFPPPLLRALPLVVQHRVWAVTRVAPTIKITDFDEKVVGKMMYMLEKYGEQEVLGLLDKLGLRMRNKQTSMKNGAGYLDTAFTTHLDVLMVQRSHPEATTSQEYARCVLSETLYQELASAIESNHWLSWEVWDQGVVSLLSKLPQDRAVHKLREIGSRSFRNVDNITGCITTILSSINRIHTVRAISGTNN